jgi:sugar (pentulose or hexulose) kinase
LAAQRRITAMVQHVPGVPESALIAGIDFSTGAVKGLVVDLHGQAVAEVRLPTDLWTEGGVSELNVFQLEGQSRCVIRALAGRLRALGRLDDWFALGVSATHHTAGRVDADGVSIRRAICWNDASLARYHEIGLNRLGGQDRARALTGGVWASRYTLSHLVKDEEALCAIEWERTRWILPHGPLAVGFLTGRRDVISASSAASTGLMDLRTNRWRPEMLEALASPRYRELAAAQLPTIVDADQAVGYLLEGLAAEAGIKPDRRPLVFPSSDDQQAGLVGGGAVDAGEVAIILGNSAVVNSSAERLPQSGTLDAMKLNWGPYLWMRCYNNGAQFLDGVVGPRPDWSALEAAAVAVPAGCGGVTVLPFARPEPSRGVRAPRVEWRPAEPSEPGVRFRAALEALAYLIAIGVAEHEAAGQPLHRLVVSGGIARSPLMVEILASVLGRPLERLQSDEGPALGAAVTALWGAATLRAGAPVSVRRAVHQLVKYRQPCLPNPAWLDAYRRGLVGFRAAVDADERGAG